MRNLTHLPEGTPINNNFALLPFGGIKNRTETEAGTPVVEENIGDILSSVYEIMKKSKVAFNGLQDNEENGYQLIEALGLFSNELNDSVPLLIKTGNIFSIPINLTILPDNYPILVKASDTYISDGVPVTFKGNGVGLENDVEYTFSPSSFISGEILLLIIDFVTTDVRMINITNPASSLTLQEIFPNFGTPIRYNNSGIIWYESEGHIFNDKPETFNLNGQISAAYGKTTHIKDSFISGKHIYCLVYFPDEITYLMVRVQLDNISLINTMSGIVFPEGIDRNPYIYTDGLNLWITNKGGDDVDDKLLVKYTINGLNLIYISEIELGTPFDKSTNSVIHNGKLYTFILNDLKQYNLATGELIQGSVFKSNVGALISFNNVIYHVVSGVGKRWNLPNLI